MKSIYYDSKKPESFGGIERLYQEASGIIPSITRDDVRKWLRTQDTYSLFKQARRRFPRVPILVDFIVEQWQADLLDVSWFEEENNGVKFILVVNDVLSKYAWARPFRNKSGKSVADAMESIFLEGRIPTNLETDQGKEFKNKSFQE